MKTYQGILRELGQAKADQLSKTMDYTYIEVGDQMIKNAKVFGGLDGKVNNALGEPVTLHVDGNYVVAMTTQEGKTYSSEKFGAATKMTVWVLILINIPFVFVLIGIPFLFRGVSMLNTMAKASSGADLPNAIQIPNVR